MYEIPILLNIQNRLWAMGWVMGLMAPLLLIIVIQNARRNHLLKQIVLLIGKENQKRELERPNYIERRAVR